MPTEIAVRFRVDPQTRRRLDRLRTEKAINVSAWLRLLVQQGLDHEFPDDIADEPNPEPVPVETPEPPRPDPAKTPIEGWKPRRLPGGEWGAVLTGPDVAELPDDDQLPRTPIVVTDNKGDAWTTTLVDLVSRTDSTVLVRTSGRPRD
ncbi:MAG: hypothetical protein OXC11_07240 [Rhodospirillales bacterium]|nr:hypothetical protein [Rhodospirillales bacterium]